MSYFRCEDIVLDEALKNKLFQVSLEASIMDSLAPYRHNLSSTSLLRDARGPIGWLSDT